MTVARTSGRRTRLALAFGLLLGAAQPVPGSESPAPHPRQASRVKREWGVDVIGVKRTAAGYMLEFRYRVIDPQRAKALFERKSKPVLLHEESGAQLVVPTPPKTGALRNSNTPLARHTYWMFFANPGGFVKSGEKVSVVIGDFRAEDIVVESGE